MNDLKEGLEIALLRCTGDAILDESKPPLCDCHAFPWPHMQRVSKQCTSRVRRVGVIVDNWRA